MIAYKNEVLSGEIMNGFIVILVFVYIFLIIYNTVWEANQEDLVTPRWFYEHKRLNWFGSYLVFVLLTICSPICLIIKIVYVIYLGIKWLITVGR